MKVIVVGDIHGDFQVINHLVKTERPDIILQCGDFGYWPRSDAGWPPTDPPLDNGSTPIYWCDGNHEDHAELQKVIAAGQTEVAPNCFYQPRGSTLGLPDGRTILFFGGADSGDHEKRQKGVDWFPQECPQQVDFKNIPKGLEIDIVISHTAPAVFNLRDTPPFGYAKGPWLAKHLEQTRILLNEIFFQYHPDQWFFGHYHIHQTGIQEGVNWTALAVPIDGGERWWIELPSEEK
jgi:hypothetical protein